MLQWAEGFPNGDDMSLQWDQFFRLTDLLVLIPSVAFDYGIIVFDSWLSHDNIFLDFFSNTLKY